MTACRRLIVNADDFGRSRGVSRGILEAHRRGIVTSTTVMVNQPGVEADLAAALVRPELGVGLHLTFTAGRPILGPTELAEWVDANGFFLEQHTVWACAESLRPAHLRPELEAQVERFRRLAGRFPDHLDCHHFVHLYPPFFALYVELAEQFDLPLRVPFPLETGLPKAAPRLPFLEGFPRDLVRGMVVTNTALLRARRLRHPDRFEARFFGREALSRGHLLALLDGLPAGTTELMCHAGYDGPGLAGSTYRAEREMELALLCDATVVERIADREIDLITFGDLA